ncbi:hypothetical protein CLV84_4005 [Neolewinella xylanilytica]|uniref:Uncharacterized protein n=1 Tax=Neolewinella xylanilytica TaxID=1514080 RepID=A0A2S6I047_9BACT|nr:hypothetical protein [Neolewinella xylanilytica]PPK84236.1 hypothetical protein CLV84_4005 [Neolewinella xylanilytica]
MFLRPDNDPDSPPSSNIFGWRISLIGLVLIVILASIAAYRHITLDVPVGFDDPLNQPESRGYYQEKADRDRAAADSLRIKEQQ